MADEGAQEAAGGHPAHVRRRDLAAEDRPRGETRSQEGPRSDECKFVFTSQSLEE